jgi:NCS2 family nucleobase:cation symporter-2
MLGTVIVCAFLEVFLSFLPPKKLREWFPPLITGITVVLIGAALTGTGMKYWGGGVVCAEMGWKMHSQVASLVGFGDGMVSPIPSAVCEAGEVALPYGSAEFIGLGLSVIIMLVLIEIFGSAFMKNANVIIALLFGYFIAGVSSYEDADGTKYEYVTSSKIDEAPWFTFLWVESFTIGFYGPAVLPLLVAFLVTSVESIGDIGATYEASELELDTEQHSQSVQGGLLADGLSSIFASVMTTMPNTTFSQNNGVISMTKCASRHAGIACGVWLVFFGLFGKIAGIITSIPDCVIGGMTIFLFSNVFTSGLKIISAVEIESRRNRFIIAMSMAFGLGVTVWPYAFQDMRASSYTAQFWTCEDCDAGEKGVRNAISIFMSTGYCVGTVVALLLNAMLPADAEVIRETPNVDDSIVDTKL